MKHFHRTAVSIATVALTLGVAAPVAAQDGARFERIRALAAEQSARQERREEKRDDRQERREDRREERRDTPRNERRDDGRQDRPDRRDDRQERREDRRDDRQDRRQERRDVRQDRREDRREIRQDRREDRARDRARDAYYARLRDQQRYWSSVRYSRTNDPYFRTPWSHRYYLEGRYWNTNRHGVDLMRQAAQHGYAEGMRAGQADRYDGWRYDYRDSWAYREGGYGYDGRYISRGHYAHYFREGFRRGYEDGYHGRHRYGRYDNRAGQFMMVGAILSAILNVDSL